MARGSRIPTAKRIINDPNNPPIDPADYSEANADHLMFLWDNQGTGEFLEDAAIAGRHLKQLFAREQVTPNMTLEVLAGVAWFAQNSYQVFAGGNSPLFVAPVTNPRIDVLTIRNDGALYVIQGAEAVSPVPPTIPSTDIPLAQVYNVVGETTIRDNDSQVAGQGYVQYDLRPFVQVAVGSSAMPKIGLVTRAQLVGSGTVVSFTGAGRLRGIGISAAAGGGGVITVTIDGNAYTLTLPGGAQDGRAIFKTSTGTTMLDFEATPAAYSELMTFFKDSLVVSSGAGAATTLVVYERE